MSYPPSIPVRMSPTVAFKSRELVLKDVPHHFEIDTHVVVDQHVAKPGNNAPVDLGVARLDLR